MNYKKVLITFIVFVTIAILVSLFIVKLTQDSNDTITVGILLPLSGDAKIYGEEMQKGIELALSKYRLNAKNKEINVVMEDDAGQAKTSVSGFRKLIDVDRAQAVIGGAMSSTAMPLAPIAKDKKVVLISPAASTPKLCSLGGYVFRVWPSDIYEATALGNLARKELGLDTAAIIYVNNDYGVGASALFAKAFESAGGTIILSEGYQQDSTDFRTIITKLLSLKPQAVYVPGYYKELVALLKQAMELVFQTQFLGGVGFQEPKILELAGKAAEGTIYTTPLYNPESDMAATKAFVEAFRNHYGDDPGIFASHAYDAARVLFATINDSQQSNGESIRNALLRIKQFPGAAGAITFTESGDVAKPVAFYIVKNGTFTRYEYR